jgi:hypothetical protein
LLHSSRIGCCAKHPWGVPSCVKDARERAFAAARAGWSDPCIFLFFCRFGSSIPGLTISNDTHSPLPTHTPSFPRRIFAPGVCNFASLTPNQRVGGAPRNVRVLSGTPVGRIMCVKDARERAYNAIRQAPSEAPRETLASRRSIVAMPRRK